MFNEYMAKLDDSHPIVRQACSVCVLPLTRLDVLEQLQCSNTRTPFASFMACIAMCSSSARGIVLAFRFLYLPSPHRPQHA